MNTELHEEAKKKKKLRINQSPAGLSPTCVQVDACEGTPGETQMEKVHRGKKTMLPRKEGPGTDIIQTKTCLVDPKLARHSQGHCECVSFWFSSLLVHDFKAVHDPYFNVFYQYLLNTCHIPSNLPERGSCAGEAKVIGCRNGRPKSNLRSHTYQLDNIVTPYVFIFLSFFRYKKGS